MLPFDSPPAGCAERATFPEIQGSEAEQERTATLALLLGTTEEMGQWRLSEREIGAGMVWKRTRMQRILRRSMGRMLVIL